MSYKHTFDLALWRRRALNSQAPVRLSTRLHSSSGKIPPTLMISSLSCSAHEEVFCKCLRVLTFARKCPSLAILVEPRIWEKMSSPEPPVPFSMWYMIGGTGAPPSSASALLRMSSARVRVAREAVQREKEWKEAKKQLDEEIARLKKEFKESFDKETTKSGETSGDGQEASAGGQEAGDGQEAGGGQAGMGEGGEGAGEGVST